MGKNGTVCTARMQDVMKYNGETVLRYRIEYPVFRAAGPASQKLNRYYKQLAEHNRHSIRSEMYCRAVRQYRYAVHNEIPMPVYEAQTDCVITEQADCIASLYMDRYEYTGERMESLCAPLRPGMFRWHAGFDLIDCWASATIPNTIFSSKFNLE